MGKRARWVFTDYLMRDGVKDSASGSVLVGCGLHARELNW